MFTDRGGEEEEDGLTIAARKSKIKP